MQRIKPLEEELLRALDRGVQIEVVTSRKRDQPCYGTFLNSDFFGDLLRRGATVCEEPNRYLHMKAYAVDDDYVSVGSFNQDKWSFYCNNEANVVVQGRGKAARDFAALFSKL